MNGLAPWLGVARAPFLLLPVTLVAAGAAAAAYEGAFGWRPTLLALVGLVLLHAAVNALNEASDMTTGIDLRTTRTPFSGGSGTLPAGRLSVRATRIFAYTSALVGGLIGGWFALQLGPMFALLMAVGAACVLFYSEFFARAGLGEVFAGLGLGALPVWGAAWVQGREPGPAALWAGVPAFLMTFNLLLLNEFPDEEADRGGRAAEPRPAPGPEGRGARLRRGGPADPGGDRRGRGLGSPAPAGAGGGRAVAAPRHAAAMGVRGHARARADPRPRHERRLEPRHQLRAGGRPRRGPRHPLTSRP